MALRVVPPRAVTSELPGGGAAPKLSVALVNNMPDGAFAATERQFLDLLGAASGAELVEARLFAMKGVPRGEVTAAHIAARYEPFEHLWEVPPEVVIVTGSEPLTSEIEDEIYWAEMTELLTTAQERVPAMLLSCLAAHAALTFYDGLARITRLERKYTGVFAQSVRSDHPLVRGLEVPILLPHSRYNAVATEAVRDAGYRIALESDEEAWTVISKRVGRCDVVLVQGHPEYEPASLLREYHRDLERYLDHERDGLPQLPLNCAPGPDWERLEQLQQRLVNGERAPEIALSFPFDEAYARAAWPWRANAIALYRNWLAAIPTGSI